MSYCAFKASLCVTAAAVALLLPACQQASPATRIEENPVMFANLPAEDKPLVRMGQIRTGMSTYAVFLAWGHPDSQPIVGEKNGKRIERWVYTATQAVTVMPSCGAFMGGRGWHGGLCTGVDTAYIPRQVACVQFEDGKVVEWESRR